MIDTNVLLSIGLSLIQTFNGVVPAYRGAVPRTVDDLRTVHAGYPGSTELYVIDRRGTEYWVAKGAICGYRCADSYFDVQDLRNLEAFKGETAMSSNEAVEAATRVLLKLATTSNALDGCKLHYKSAASGFPFFEIYWLSNSGRRGPVAKVEIDGRSREIVSLLLFGAWFQNPDIENRIRREAFPGYTNLLELAASKFGEQFPEIAADLLRPAPEYVATAAENARSLAQAIGFSPGSAFDVAQVDWRRTTMGMDGTLSGDAPVCRIVFRDDSCIDAIDGRVFTIYGRDRLYGRSIANDDWRTTDGDISEICQNKAKDLFSGIERAFSISARPDAELTLGPPFVRGMTSSNRPTRALLQWYARPDRSIRKLPALEAEFDLATGFLTYISFSGSNLISALIRNQQRFQPTLPTVSLICGGWINGIKSNRPGMVSFQRDCGTAKPLKVLYTISPNGERSTSMTNQASIPKGKLTVDLELGTGVDPRLKTGQSVVVSIIPPTNVDTHYQIGRFATVTNQIE